SPLSVFTRSGRLSTWRRFSAELSASHVLFFESPTAKVPVASIPLLHLMGAGVPSSDLVSIGPGGIELRLSPLSMTDRHRRTTGSANPANDWLCRVYLLLDSLTDRDRWLHELNSVAVPSAEQARQREEDRERTKMEEKLCDLVDKMDVAQTAYAKKVFVDGGHRVVSMPLDMDATLIDPPEPVVRKPVPMAFGKPATFSISVSPDSATASSFSSSQPQKKRMRARRRSNSVADINKDDPERTLRRKGSGASTVLEVVGKAMERRPGTI
ncbi:hypothetical protein GGI21_005057, partial [Coemansia aciculifera]